MRLFYGFLSMFRIRIRIHMFLGLPDPHPNSLDRGEDPRIRARIRIHTKMSRPTTLVLKIKIVPLSLLACDVSRNDPVPEIQRVPLEQMVLRIKILPCSHCLCVMCLGMIQCQRYSVCHWNRWSSGSRSCPALPRNQFSRYKEFRSFSFIFSQILVRMSL